MLNAVLLIIICGLAGPIRAQSLTTGETFRLSIQDAIAKAVDNSPRVKQAAAELAGQMEHRSAAWADVGPRVKAEYSKAVYESEQKVRLGTQDIVTRPKEISTGALVVVQPLTGAVALTEKALFEANQGDIRDIGLKIAKSETAFLMAEGWLKGYLATSQLAITLASVASAEKQARDAAALERAGRMNRGDVLKLELAVSEAKARAAQARAAAEVVLASLKEAVGLPMETPLELVGELPEISENDPELATAAKEAMGRRLEPRLAKDGISAATFAKKLAYTNFSPSINAFAKWERNFGDPVGFAASSTKPTASYGIQASWDLWNNGAHIFAVREAVQGINKAEEGARAIDMQIRLDVQTSLANLKAARETLALAKVAVIQAEEAYRIEQVRFRTGSRSATDLILAETSNTSAKGRLVLARTELITWSLRLKKALGDEQPTI
jgi:outer membrane protein TolC